MKTLHLDIVFDTRNINWRVAPVGTVRNGQKYELHLTKESNTDERTEEIIQEFKDILMELFQKKKQLQLKCQCSHLKKSKVLKFL